MTGTTTNLRRIILKTLSQADTYVSGQQLSESLKVSRTTIWKHIQALREKGYLIESVSNQGYRLLQTPDDFIPEEILRNLETGWLGKEIVYYHEVDSTNTQAKINAMDYPHGTVFLADTQKGGRGRLGRHWSSVSGKGIWVSILLRPNLHPTTASQFPLITAVAIAETLREIGIEAEIKWPNDLLIHEKKVCGILTEMGAELDQINYLVIGIGLNVKHRLDDFPPEIQKIATSLEIIAEKEIERTQLFCHLLDHFEHYYQLFHEKGFEPILQQWRQYNCTLGKETLVSRFNQPPLKGKAIDINIDGSLILELESGEVRNVSSGEIQIGE